MSAFSHIWALRPLWFTIIAVLAPLALIYETPEKEMRCAYGICVMAILWVTEAIPIPVTALLPIFLFPMLEVARARDMSSAYITDTTMLFLGGLVVAIALEESGLHRRISLLVMRLVGAKPMWLMLGLMATTWFLSMWISNTAATSMMIPIISAVLETIRDVSTGPNVEAGTENEGYQMDDVHINGQVENDMPDSHPDNTQKYVVKPMKPTHDSEEIQRMSKAFALCVAYGANIGGIATLTGTPPNLVLKEQADKLYAAKSGNANEESGISFAKWMGFAFPMSLITLLISWIWLQLLYLRCSCFRKMDEGSKRAINATILRQYKALGTIRFVEVEVLIVFIVLVILWLFRDAPNIKGWGVLFEEGETQYVSDSTPAIVLSVLLFLLPAERPKVFCWSDETGIPSYKPILTWSVVSAKLAWGVIVLLGGGFALARASTSSGLSKWVGDQMEVFQTLDKWVMNLIICLIVAGMTELTSNTATATLLMPIMAALGQSTGIHPLYLMISATVACSFAFMLPVATPPNAIVFSTGYLTVLDMVIAGIPMNIIAIICLTLAINTWGTAMYDLDAMPDIFTTTTTLATTAMANMTSTTPLMTTLP